MFHCECRGAGLSLQLRVNKPIGPVGDCCVGGWVQPLADNKNTTFVGIGDGRCSTFGASNHKSTRATPSSFVSNKYK